MKAFDCQSVRCRIGVLLAQLGTPDEPTPAAVKSYLKEFLWDQRVVEVNRPLWYLILNGIILRKRPKRSAALYQRMHENYGPVLLTYTQSLTAKLQTHCNELRAASPAQQTASEESRILVRFGMRYGNPSLKNALEDMVKNQHCDRLLLVPLYPQYSAATSGSTYDAVFKEFLKWRWIPSLRIMPPYYHQPLYLQSLAALINQALKKRDQIPDRVLLSYHGIPKRYVEKGDPYACMCLDTTRRLSEILDYPSDRILHAYQSRFGKEPWLEPYTDASLEDLAKQGVKDVIVACPSFTMDCLETLDEIGVESRRLFLKHGGERFELVSCLNDGNFWAQSLARLIERELSGW